MPKLSCPRCDVRVQTREAMLESRIYCPTCGNCLWEPVRREIAPPPIQAPTVAEPIIPRPKVIFLEPEPSRFSAGAVVSLLGCGALFVGAVILATIAISDHKPTAKAERKARGLDIPRIQADFPDHTAQKSPTPPQTETAIVPAVRSTREGFAWTLDDLHVYLINHGAKCTAAARHQATYPGLWLTPGDGTRLLVEQVPGPTAAREVAAQAAKGDKAFIWGRFVIVAPDSAFFRAVRAALP